MPKVVLLFSVTAAFLGLACSVTTTETPNDGGAAATDGGTTTSSDGSSTAPNKVPATSTTEAKVVVGAVCPAFTACAGTLDGTYDYTGGCLGDLLADAKKQCPALDASGAKVVVTGSLHFLGGNALTRDVTSSLTLLLEVEPAG